MSCNGLFGRLFGHKFEAVFDEQPSGANPFHGLKTATHSLLVELAQLDRKRTLRCIYCVRCGQKKARTNEAI